MFTIIKRSESTSLLVSERAQIAPRWLVKRRAECNAPSGNACTAKEYNQAKRVDELARQRASADCSASAPRNGAKHEVPPQSGEARKEYNASDRADELAVLDYTPFRRKCASRPWHFVLCSIGIEPPRSNLRHSP